MSVLFTPSERIPFETCAMILREEGIRVDIAETVLSIPDRLETGLYRVVVLDLEATPRSCEILRAAVSGAPPTRSIALADAPVSPELRRRAYGAGAWHLVELPPEPPLRLPESLVPAILGALEDQPQSRVLLVDGSREVTSGIGSLLEEEGYQVEAASSTSEALERMAGTRYALVITGSRRVGPGRFRVLREAHHLQPDVPVMVLAATPDDATFLRAIELGARMCIWKPSEPEEILREARAAMAARHAWGSSRR